MTTNTAAPSWSAILGTWTFTPVADLLIALAAVAYLLLLRRRRRHADAAHWPSARTTSAGLALAVLVLALNSSLAAYAMQLFWVHMVVHLLLIMVVPVLLVWAQPIRLLRDRAGPGVRAGVDRAVAGRAAKILTAPTFTVPLYTAVLVLTHLTGFQQAMTTCGSTTQKPCSTWSVDICCSCRCSAPSSPAGGWRTRYVSWCWRCAWDPTPSSGSPSCSATGCSLPPTLHPTPAGGPGPCRTNAPRERSCGSPVTV